MRWRLSYNARLWLLLAVLLVAVNVWGYVTRGMTAQESWTYRQVMIVVLIPLLAVFITRLVVPRRKSRVEAFRPSPFDLSDAGEPGAEQQAVGKPARPDGPPQDFSKRLASYLHVPEEEVLAEKPPATSSMPFWSGVPLPQRSVWAKSVEYIRAVLARIRATVRGE